MKAASILKYAHKDSDMLEITIARNIVEDLIGTMYFHPEDDADDGDDAPMSKANAMRLFKLNVEDTVPVYKVCIKNTTRFWLAIDQTSSGRSFQQSAAVMEQYRVRTKNPKLVGLSRHTVSQYVRVLVGANLQSISNILSRHSQLQEMAPHTMKHPSLASESELVWMVYSTTCILWLSHSLADIQLPTSWIWL